MDLLHLTEAMDSLGRRAVRDVGGVMPMGEADDSTLGSTHDMCNERHSFATGVSSLVLYFAWVESAKAKVYVRSKSLVTGSQGEREFTRGRRDCKKL